MRSSPPRCLSLVTLFSSLPGGLSSFRGTCGPTMLLCRLSPPGSLLQGLNALGRLGLRERIVHRLLGLIAQRLKIGTLGTGHPFVARRPVIGVFDPVPSHRCLIGAYGLVCALPAPCLL